MTSPPPAVPPSTLVSQVKELIQQLVRKPPILLLIMLLTLPVMYLVVYGRGSAAGVVIIGAAAMQVITGVGGLKTGVVNAPLLSGFLALSCVVSDRPLAAGFVALAVALWASMGAASGKGAMISMAASIMSIMLVVPPQITHSTNPHTARNTIAVLLYALAASAWGVVLGLLTRRGRTIPKLPRSSWQWGVTQGVLVGIVMFAVAVFATSRNLGQGGAWLLMTVYLVFKPLAPTPWRRSIDRAFGTLIGVGIVALYLASLPTSAPPLALLLPASLMLTGAACTLLSQRWPYWCYVALFTPAIVLFLACTSAATKTVPVARTLDALRIEYSLLGVAIALAVQGLLIGIDRVFPVKESKWMKSVSATPSSLS